jgi:hypothetical protein
VPSSHRFPLPWSAEEQPACFVVARALLAEDTFRRKSVAHGVAARGLLAILSSWPHALEHGRSRLTRAMPSVAEQQPVWASKQPSLRIMMPNRLLNVSWCWLREATTIETQADHLRDYRQNHQLLPGSRDVIHALFRQADSIRPAASHDAVTNPEIVPSSALDGKSTRRLSNSPAAFCGSPICRTSRSIV